MAQGGQQIAIKSGAIRAVFMSFIFDFVHNFVNFILIQTTKRLAIKITTVEQYLFAVKIINIILN